MNREDLSGIAVKCLFFDIGSTLVDETRVDEDIFHRIALSANVSDEYVVNKAIEFYKQNKRGHKEVMKLLGVGTSLCRTVPGDTMISKKVKK